MKNLAMPIIMLFIVFAGIYGWIMNIIEIFGLEPFVWSGKVIVGIIGVFIPPVGAIMGLFVW